MKIREIVKIEYDNISHSFAFESKIEMALFCAPLFRLCFDIQSRNFH